MSSSAITRRDFLRGGITAGVGLAATELAPAMMAAAAPSPGQLSDIEHVVIVIQENRSFDHYFGSYRGVRGFSDPAALKQSDGLSIFAQPGFAAGRNPDGHLLPFHLDPSVGNADCIFDVSHEWAAQHSFWNGGRMDAFVSEQLRVSGGDAGPFTMGYYTRAELDYFYALADAFTICDGYHCSVLGATDPNRLYAMTATIDPEGRSGGPALNIPLVPSSLGSLTWTTMPEQLESRGVTWAVYSDQEVTDKEGNNSLIYFRRYQVDASFTHRGLRTTYPAQFDADVAASRLPQVSWVIVPFDQLEHPPSPSQYGAFAVDHIVSTLNANAAVWAKTALFITYDENGGYFDHVPPPTPPPATAGEYLRGKPRFGDSGGVDGPIGLGFRVPLLVVSPFSRGGYVCSDTFDHTSLLRFLETRFGAEVPNLSEWRRRSVGDLTTAFNFAMPDTSVPSLPRTSLSDPTVASQCAAFHEETTVYAIPVNTMPAQEPGSRKRPSGPVSTSAPAPTSGRSLAPVLPLALGAAALLAVGAAILRRRAQR